MRCIYFDGETCHAHPALARLAYKPTDEEKKLCNGTEFHACPRLQAFINHMKAMLKPST